MTKRFEILEMVKSGELTEEEALIQIRNLNTNDEADENGSNGISSISISSISSEILFSLLTDDLLKTASVILRVEKTNLLLDEEMAEYGFESISYTELADQINSLFNTDLGPATFFEYTTFRTLADYLIKEHNRNLLEYYRESFTEPDVEAVVPEIRPSVAISKRRSRFEQKESYVVKKKGRKPVKNAPVAIIGISGILPQSRNIDVFWENLKDGKDMVTEIPADRWDFRQYEGDPLRESNKTYAKWGGFIPDIDKFDAKFFNISPQEAELMDPQQRIFIQTVWNAIEDGGYKPSDLSNTKTGVFVGAATSDYAELLTAHNIEIQAHTGTGMFHSLLANRISYILNLHGPSKPVDTACASSLVAVHRAVEAIREGQCDMAIAGGVNALLSPTLFISFAKAGMLSKTGRCKSFDASADGYVRSEGVGAILLKPLEDAERDNDHIYAVILGTAENHSGRSKSLTSPNPAAQANVIVDAYTNANIDPRTVTYIEAQATGTHIGDPIEINGLKKAFSVLFENWGLKLPDSPYCGIGTVKTNIGHLEIASGMAGILRVILSMKHKTLTGLLHFRELNPGIKLEGSPFYIADKTQPWKELFDDEGRPIPRRAGVSAFGFGGSNSHIVLEEYVPKKDRKLIKTESPHIILLSAKDEESLLKSAENLYYFLKNQSDEFPDEYTFLSEAAYTLQTGREALEHRLAMIVRNKSELIERLEAYARGVMENPYVLTGFSAKKKNNAEQILDEKDRMHVVQQAIADKNFVKLARLWMNGFDISWELLYEGFGKDPGGKESGGKKPGRISLPGYNFRKTRYWIPETADESRYSLTGTDRGNKQLTHLHPLVMENVSTLAEQRFRSVFSGNEFVFSDHVVLGEKILPGVASLEMIRAAAELAGEQPVSVIEKILWLSPIVLDKKPKELFVGVYPAPQNSTEVEVYSLSGDEETIHAKAIVGFGDPAAADKLDITAIRKRCTQTLDRETCYTLHRQIGLSYGSGFQGIQEIFHGKSEAFARIELPVMLEKESRRYVIHPAIVDSALQSMISLIREDTESLKSPPVPFTAARIRIIKPPGKECFAYISSADKNPNRKSQSRTFDITITDTDGNPCIILDKFSFMTMKLEKKSALKDDVFYYTTGWAKSDAVKKEKAEKGSILFIDLDADTSSRFRESSAVTGIDGITAAIPADGTSEPMEDVFRIDAANPDDYITLLQTLKKEKRFPRYIIHNLSRGLFQADADVLKQQLESGIYSLFYLAKALVAVKITSPVEVVYLYPGTEENIQPQYEAVGGFFKTLSKENPKLQFRAAAKGGLAGDALAAIIRDELLIADAGAKSILYENNGCYVRKARLIDPASPGKNPVTFTDTGVYIITGGMGGLGFLFARHIAAKCRGTIVLTGRSAPTPEMEKKLKKLESAGNRIKYIQSDIGIKTDADRLIAKVKEDYGRISGIIHSAGIVRDSFIVRKTREEFDEVMQAKVFGTLFLDAATADEKLDFFVLFSSITAVIGNTGQADYAFANNFMDRFADLRNTLAAAGSRSGRTISIDWPLWKEGGMRVDEASMKFLFTATGMVPLKTETGFAAFDALLSADMVHAGVFYGDLGKFAGQLGIPVPAGYSFRQEKRRTVEQKNSGTDEVKKHAPGNLLGKVENALLGICARLLKVDEKEIDVESEFADFGLDSILMIKLMNRIEELYGETVEPNSVTQYPTIRSFSTYLIDNRIVKQAGGEKADDEVVETADAAVSEKEELPAGTHVKRRPRFAGIHQPEQTYKKIAVIGMACRFPNSPTLEAFWENLKNGKSCISEIPPDRWDVDAFYSPDKSAEHKSYSKWAGFIGNIDAFDAGFFGISKNDALLLDPQHRILLELTQELLDRAGYRKEDISNTKTGVFLGGNESNYAQGNIHLIPDKLMRNFVVNKIQNMMAARISDYYNLKGASLVIDTACSSSLVALHEACRSISNGECDAAITGGIEILIDPYMHIGFSKSGALSDGPASFVFDERANGFVLGEGAGLILLKDYEKALVDGDQIIGIILGSAVNNDGHTMGLTVPSQEGQMEVINQAIERSEISPDTISLYEAHGTGTLLGDPIEIKAASQVYGRSTQEKQYCAVGSVKSNIGHLLRAAGIAGVIKLLLSMQYKQIPPTLNCEKPHPRFKFTESPFYPTLELKDWMPRNGVWRAAISSFGFGGTNSHVILEAFDKDTASGYSEKRKSLPVTQFNRKHYWLGREIGETAEKVKEAVLETGEKKHKINKEEYKKLLRKLMRQEIDPELFKLLDEHLRAPES